MRGKLVTIAIAGMMLAMAAVVPAMAGQAKTKHFATTVTIKLNADAGTISGKVKSSNDKCVGGRKAILNQDGQDVFTAHADDKGNYGIKTNDGSPLPSGSFEVHSPKLKLGKHKVCDPGDSKIARVP